jgi:hypothetical protein
MATTTRPCAQVHDIYMSRHTTAMTTRPCAQAHAIFNVVSHDGNKDNKKTAATTPYIRIAKQDDNHGASNIVLQCPGS